jgi:glycolate oxidase FAD binding subunit
MTLVPGNVRDLQAAIASAGKERRPLAHLELSRLNRIVEHHPEDLTCTVECGCTLASLQAVLTEKGQWLPVDPPHPDFLTIRDLIDHNLSGPRRFGFGTVRDYLIGLEVILGDGSWIRSGGRVVKNVAGYDLHKLFIGSWGTLGVPVLATFKLLPLPRQSVIRSASHLAEGEALHKAQAARDTLSGLIALDICRARTGQPGAQVFVELAGDDLARGCERADAIGFTEEAARGWEDDLWHDRAQPPSRLSVPPAQLGTALESLGNRRFVARAGNGIVYHDGPPAMGSRPGPAVLVERLKKAFDPFGVLKPVPTSWTA